MATEKENQERLRVANSMIVYGGGFVQALGQTLRLADSNNTARIKKAFPDYWDKYNHLDDRINNCSICNKPKVGCLGHASGPYRKVE